MRRKDKPDSFSWHEALDRSFLLFELFDERVAQHPAIQADKELKRDAKEIASRLFRLYQAIGAKTLTDAKDER